MESYSSCCVHVGAVEVNIPHDANTRNSTIITDRSINKHIVHLFQNRLNFGLKQSPTQCTSITYVGTYMWLSQHILLMDVSYRLGSLTLGSLLTPSHPWDPYVSYYSLQIPEFIQSFKIIDHIIFRIIDTYYIFRYSYIFRDVCRKNT